MRVIAGKYRGNIITPPEDDFVRPTADKVKEAVFNILQTRIEGAVFLDLFAGSGGIGIEAASRGAAKVTFVDSHRRSFKLIKANVERLGIGNAEVVYSDALTAVKAFYTEGRKYDLIYIDPPYALDADKLALQAITDFDIFSEEGLIIVEHKAKKDLQIDTKAFIIKDTRRYGTVHLTILAKACLC